MDTTRIADLLQPFLGKAHDQRLTTNDLQNNDLQHISTYIDLLLRWNARINLTAIRNEEEIVTRHFGESLFAARHLFRQRRRERPSCSPTETLIDIGSGAGFPGIPIKIWVPEIHLTLIESNQKKATFLREVIRTITLTNINVFADRAEAYPNPPAETVTLRAVEHFDNALPIAASLVAPEGRLALLISEPQLTPARDLTPEFAWQSPLPIPNSSTRILAIGRRES
jgi:16S rRNA (guanine527-N7)-methyltransferase